jgi:hypothetical protein
MLKTYKIIFLSSLIFFVTGCEQSFIQSWEPPPPTYTLWLKANAYPDDVIKAMRECGYENVYGYDANEIGTKEDIATRKECMVKKGFRLDHWKKA